MATDKEKIEQVIASIIDIAGDHPVGVFHLNKLAYLFEFFHIKNFGKRFTNEHFIKLPHGPVITNYKMVLKQCNQKMLCKIDTSILTAKRDMDDFNYSKIEVLPSSQTHLFVLPAYHPASNLLSQIINKYLLMSSSKIEKEVYKTQPVMTYLEKVKQGYKKRIGSPILKECIPMTHYKEKVKPAIKLYYDHLTKYPDDDIEQMEKTATEFQFLEQLRPELPAYE